MPNTTPPMSSLQLKEIFEAKIEKLKNKHKLKSSLHLHEGTSMFTLRSKSPMTPSTSPVHLQQRCKNSHYKRLRVKYLIIKTQFHV